MRKDLLLSLLAAGVTPLGALANVDVNKQIPNGSDWTISGFESDTFTPDALGNHGQGEITLNLASAGYLETTITNLLPGKTYVLGFTANNAVVTVNGVEVADGGTFTLGADETEAVVRVANVNVGLFSIGAFSLSIEFNNAKAKKALEDLMHEVDPPQVDPEDDSEEAEALKAYYNAYYKDLVDTINENLAKLNGDNVSLTDYENLKLEDYPDGDVITNDIKKLDEALTEDYTTRVAAEKAAFDNYQANLNSLNFNFGEYVLNTIYISTQETTAGPLVKSLADECESLNARIADVKAEIEALKADRKALEVDPEDFKASEAYTTVSTEANAIKSYVGGGFRDKWLNYKDQDAAWKEIWNNPDALEGATTMANLEKQYTGTLNYLMGLTDDDIAPDEAGYFTDQIAKLKNIYSDAVAEVNAKIPEDATSVDDPKFTDQLKSVRGIISNARGAMSKLESEVKGKVNAFELIKANSNAAYNAAMTALNTLQANLDNVKIDAEKVGHVEGANMYQNLITDWNAIQKEITDTRTAIEAAKAEYKATWTDAQEQAIQDEIDTLAGYVADAEQAYNNYKDVLNAIEYDLEDQLKAATSVLEQTQNNGGGNDANYKYNIVYGKNSPISGSREAIETAIAKFTETATASYKDYVEGGYKDGMKADNVASTIDKTSPEYTNITSSIGKYETLGKNLINGFLTADKDVAGLENISLDKNKAEWINTWRANALTGNPELDTALETINGYKTSTTEEIKKLRDSIDAAYNLRPNGQGMLTEITAVLVNINDKKSQIESTIEAAKGNFMYAIEKGNISVVQTQWKEVHKAWVGGLEGEESDAVKKALIGEGHWDTVAGETSTIATELYTNIPTDLSNAENAADEQAYEDIDTHLNKLVDQLNQINSDCEKYKVNEEVNAALQKLIAETAQPSIDRAKEYVDNNTLDPAKTTLLNKIADEQKALCERNESDEIIGGIANAINVKYTSAGTDNLLTKADQTTFSDTINDIAQEALDIKTNAISNENNHNTLLGLASITAAKVDAVLTQAEKLTDSELNSAEAVAKAVDAIKAEMDKLTPLNNDVQTAYGKIELCSDEETATLEARYNDITAAVDEALRSALDDYQTAVLDANQAVFDEYFEPLYEALKKALKDAEDANTEYSTNPGAKYTDYRNGVVPFTEALETVLTPYQGEEGNIVKLRKEADDYFNSLLENIKPSEAGWQQDEKTVITKDTPEFAALCTKAEQYTTAINNAVDTMETSANDYAEKYFNKIHDEAQATVDAATKKMEAAMTDAAIANPIIEALTKTFQSYIDSAKTTKARYEAEELALSPNMGELIDILDKCNSEEVKLRTEAAGNTYWLKVYGNALDSINAASNIIDKLENLSEAQKQGYKDNINITQRKNAEDLNTEEANKYAHYKLLDNLKNLTDSLNEVLKNVDTQVTKATEADQKVVKNRAAYNEWLKVVKGLDDDYTVMAGWVGALGLPAEEIEKLHIDAIGSNIVRFDSNIRANEENVLDRENLYTAIQNKIKEDINAMYYEAYRAELEFLQGRLQVVAEALTALSLNDPDFKDFKTLNDRISDLAEEISNDLNNRPANYDTAVLDKLTGYEYEINELGKTIEGDDWEPVTGNTDAIVEALNNKYDEIKADIQAEQTVLEGCEQSVKDKYQEALDTLVTDLDNVKENIDKAGTSIIALKGKYESQMNAIAAQLDTLTTDIATADAAAKAEAQKKAISDAAYDTLNAELAGLKKQLEEAQKTIKGYNTINPEDYEEMIANVQSLIDAAQTELEAKKAVYDLTADSTLPNEADIVDGISTLLKTATKAETKHQIDTANEALEEADKFIAAGNFLNKEDLLNRLNVLKAAANTLVVTDNAEDAPGVIKLAEDITEEAKALRADAEENKVVVGDLNGNDILNATDLQDLMNLILSDDELDDMTKARADVNGDGTISAADIVALVDLVMGRSEAQVRINASRPAQAGENSISIYNVGSENGVTRYAICLNNAATFVNGQMDINLPAGMEIVNEAVAERASSLELMSRDHANGTHRILLASFEINEIADNQGALIYIDVEGAGNFTVDNVIFADANARAYALDGTSSDTTALQTITNGLKNLGDKIYNASGVMMDKIQKGINIIRKSDGSTQKTIGK